MNDIYFIVGATVITLNKAMIKFTMAVMDKENSPHFEFQSEPKRAAPLHDVIIKTMEEFAVWCSKAQGKR